MGGNLTDDQRQGLLQYLLKESNAGILPRGTLSSAASAFVCNRSTVWRIWDRYKRTTSDPTTAVGIRSKIKANSGRRGYNQDDLLEKIAAIPAKSRTKPGSITAAIGVSVGVVRRLIKRGAVRKHSNTIKPLLTPQNRAERVRFACSFVNMDTFEYQPMLNVVHVDEKWFYNDVDRRTYYLLPEEEPPIRRWKSKRFVGKTMFLTAVARPRYDYTHSWFASGFLYFLQLISYVIVFLMFLDMTIIGSACLAAKSGFGPSWTSIQQSD